MRIVHLSISYDGINFCGYQIQKEGRTVQEELQKVISKINDTPTKVDGAGRTDRGVHALDQHIRFETNRDIEEEKWLRALNTLLPDDIFVNSVTFENENFHPRFNAIKKEYLYKINIGKYNPCMRNYVFQLNKKVDLEKMISASRFFIGKHDFRSFCSNEEIDGFSFEREIFDITFKLENDILLIQVEGNGFMRYMVRNIVGTLLEIGLNKKEDDIITSRLDNTERNIIPYCAPACGLYLQKIYY